MDKVSCASELVTGELNVSEKFERLVIPTITVVEPAAVTLLSPVLA